MKKKILATVLAAVMVLSLAACGDSGSSSGGSSESSSDAGGSNESSDVSDSGGSSESSDGGDSAGTVLQVAVWDTNQERGLSQILEDFTAETGIKADISVITWNEYWTMLEAAAQGGSLPDVFWMHSNESERYMSNDMLLDLTDKIAESDVIDPSNYPEDIWGLYTYEGKYYAVPKDVDTIALWYNKAMFDEAGVEYPTADWTWDDMGAAAKKITEFYNGEKYGLVMSHEVNQEGYYNMIYSNNGEVISDDKTKSGWDSPETIEAMQILEGWINDGILPPVETMTENSQDVLIQSGQVAMACMGSWMLAAMRDNEYASANCDVVELPKNAKTGRRVSIYNGLGWAAAANGSNPEAAWKLIEYLGSKEAQQRQAELGVTMSAYKNTSDAWAGSADFNLQAYLNMMDDMVIRPYSRSTVTWEQEDIQILKKVFTGEATMEEACIEMADSMNAMLAEE